MSSSASASEAVRLWTRAAALGSLWAALEVTAGSLLHNLHIPFAGTVLAASGILLMTTALQRWPSPGLVWRAALIAALMKSISPSAVILGPMVGIFSEGVILFLAVSVLGRGLAGCLIGGALAVAWTLAQKVLSLLITYGPDFIALYEGLVRFAARATGWQSLGPEEVVFGLLAAQAGLGAAAGACGWWVGRQPCGSAVSVLDRAAAGATPAALDAEPGHPATLPLLMLALVLGLWWIGRAGLVTGGAPLLVAAGLAVYRYRASMRRLAKPRLWIELALVLLLSGLVLGALGNRGSWREGLLAGAEMAVRAVFVVVMFSAIGIELKRSPWIRRLSHGPLAPARQALEAAFRALPDFIASLRDLPSLWRHPRLAIGELLNRAELWQREFEREHAAAPHILLTGAKGAGKTTLLEATARLLMAAGAHVAGILSPGEFDNGRRARFDLLILDTGRRLPLAERDGNGPPGSGRGYRFLTEAIAAGRAALSTERIRRADVLFIDEVGPLELRGEGWAPALDEVASAGKPMVWVVRPGLLDEVRRRWQLDNAIV
ncbi:MAG: nucleoside-triphosphatase, partial [Bryobacteraceae bacterium]